MSINLEGLKAQRNEAQRVYRANLKALDALRVRLLDVPEYRERLAEMKRTKRIAEDLIVACSIKIHKEREQ